MISKHKVSIVRCFPDPEKTVSEMYDVVKLAVDLIGGIDKYVQSGDYVMIKPNMFGNAYRPKISYSYHKGSYSFSTDPRVAIATAMLIRDEGCSHVAIVECEDFENKYTGYGYRQMCKEYNIPLLDFNKGPFKKFSVPYDERSLFPDNYDLFDFQLNEELDKTDLLISLSKLKIHNGAGITLCMKNLFGITPNTIYGKKIGRHSPRVIFHKGSGTEKCAIPYVINALNMIFRNKMSLSMIEGMVGSNYTEGYGGEPIEMDVIVAGDNVVATDAVGALIMKVNPTAEFPNHPFFYSKNHLNFAHSVGLGSNDPNDIELHGEKLNKIVKKFVNDSKRNPYFLL